MTSFRPRLFRLPATAALGLLLISFGAAASAARADPSPRVEGRALWVVRSSLLTPASIDSAVARAVEIHATDVFVQVRGRGDAFYPSTLVPYAEAVRDTTFDGLAYAIERAHASGLALHAWTNVFLVWSADHAPLSPQHVFNAHPEWFEVDRRGRSMATLSPAADAALGAEGAFVAPSDTAARAHFVAVVEDLLARYALDGVHLDYVRYPSREVGFTPAAREGFVRETGVDPLTIRREDRTLAHAWDVYRAEQVTALVRDVRAAVDRTRPGALLSAAVLPDPDDALVRCGQDWPAWLSDGLLDFAAPMCYGTRWSTAARQIRHAQAAAGDHPLYAGIAVYNESAAAAAEKLVLARSTGVAGLALFSYNAISDRNAYWSYLARNVFADTPVSPFAAQAAALRAGAGEPRAAVTTPAATGAATPPSGAPKGP